MGRSRENPAEILIGLRFVTASSSAPVAFPFAAQFTADLSGEHGPSAP
jgi:hypothetical protein